ncbi:sulfotransferase [Chromohalobacter sp. HP20-39]|uniref:sulfotransferase family protein n=1 Tax=Chromohalobacter sp. HP20-39 TaxID=3079306 RepID=UPI00294B84F8|nr:sulfotransferase [Chromohalobacter sp. HP20-39]MDV6320551.1 sulfotransferase [Chromohalobacter sp. HP20-39]
MKPFFILGAPRSGTTMLRDIFKQIEDYYSPEETHFFRWSAPYRGFEFGRYYQNNPVLKKHRQIDGISDERFFELYESCNTKAEFTDAYCTEVAKKKGAVSWFEKTPQNVYGLPMIIDQFPEAKVVHLVRHPLSVAKSLMAGKVMKPQSFVGALNYWREAVATVNVLKPVMGNQLIEIRYEDIQSDPAGAMERLVKEVIEKPVDQLNLNHVKTKIDIPYADFLDEQIDLAIQVLGQYPSHYGYELK